MATWKKVIVSGSNADLADVSASGNFLGNLIGNATGDLTGNADTATALANARTINGTSFDGTGNITLGNDSVTAAMMADNSIDSGAYVDASIDTAHIANAQVTTAKIADDGVTAAKLASNAVVNASIASNAAIAHSKLAALASTKVLVGNGSNVATEVPLSGDVTMANTGAVTIGAAKVVNSMIGDGAVDTEEIADDAITAAKLASNAVVNASIASNAAIAHSKLAALAATKVLVGNGSNVATEVALSGDVTMNNAGAVTIANTAVETAMIADNAVDGDKLADSVTVAAELTVAGHGLTVKQISASAHISGTLSADIIGFASGSFLNVEASNDIKAAQFYGGGAGITGVSTDIDGLDALGGTGVAQGDHFMFSDAGTEKKITFSNLEDAIFGNVSGDATIAAGGALTIANTSVETGMIADDAVTAAKLASNAVVNASIASNAAIAHSKLAALAATKVLVGNGSNVATEVALSGDVTMNNAGAVTIGTGVVEHAMLAADAVDGDNIADDVINSEHYVAASIDNEHLADNAVNTAEIADNAVTLGKMAGLARGKIISGDASGDPVALAAGGANTVLQSDGTDITYNTVATAMIADNAVSLAKMAGLARGKIISGDASGDPVALAAGGANTVLQSDGTDITYNTVATAMIADDAVTAAKLASNAVVNASIASNAAIAHSKLAALAATKVLVGNGSNVATEVALSGDVTMNNAGAVTIANTAVETAMIAADAITGAKIADNAINSEHYTDGSIDTAHIADNQVNGDKLADDIVIAGALTVTGDLLVSGDSVTVNTANLNVEDPFILLKSGSSNTSDSGIIFGGSTGTANTGKALVWDASYNSNDGRLAVSTTAVAGDATANFDGSGTAGYYVAGVFAGSEADAATAKADHAGNIRIESSEIYIYV